MQSANQGSRRILEPEKGFGSSCGSIGNFLECCATQCSDFLGDKPGVGRLTTLAPLRLGCEVGAVGLDHEGIHGNCGDNIPHKCCIFECDDAGEGNKVAERKNLSSLIRRVAEAMEHTPKTACVGLQNIHRVIPRIALVDDDVEAEFRRKVELGREGLRLCGLVGAIHNRRLSVIRSFRLQSADASASEGSRW